MGDWKYDGFISYSTRADGDLAPKLQDGLERLAKPWHRRRALKIFQDIDDLAATSDLSSTLRSELAQSQTMVFLASPESAASPWCNDELSYWIEQRPPNELVVVLTGGTLEFDKDADHPVRFETSTAAPPAFASLTAVPLYIDLRYDDAELARMDVRRDPEFRAKLTKISAALHSNRTGTTVEPRDIDSKDLAEHRKAMRLRTIAIVALLVLTSLATVAALYAREQRQDAVSQRDRARSEALAARSLLEAERDPVAAAQLALEARTASVTPEAEQAVFAASMSRWRAAVDFAGDTVSISDDGETALISGDEGWKLLAWDGSEIHTSATPGHSYLAPAGDRIVTLASDRIELADRQGTVLATVPVGGFETLAFRDDGTEFVVGGPTGALRWVVSDLERDPSTPGDPLGEGSIAAVAYAPMRTQPDSSGSTVVTAEGDQVKVWIDPATGSFGRFDFGEPAASPLPLLALALDESLALVTVAQDKEVDAQLALAPQLVRSTRQLNSTGGLDQFTDPFRSSLRQQAKSAAFSDDATVVAVGNIDGTIDVLTTLRAPGSCAVLDAVQTRLATVGRHDGPVTGVALSADRTRMVTIGGGQARLWTLDGVDVRRSAIASDPAGEPLRIATLGRSDGGFEGIAISADGERVLVAGEVNRLLWHLGSGEVTPVGATCVEGRIADVSEDGNRLLTNTGGANVSFLEEHDAEGNLLRVHPESEVTAAAYADGRGSVVTVGLGGTVLWDSEWSTSTTLSPTGSAAVAVAGLGAEVRFGLLSADGRSVDIADADGRVIATLDRGVVGWHDGRATAVAGDPGGRFFVTGGLDRTARIWSRDGDLLAALVGHGLAISDIAVNSDGDRIATASRDGSVRVWDVDGDLLAVAEEHVGAVTGVAFAASDVIASTGVDRTVRVWRWHEPAELLGRVEARASVESAGG